MRVSRGGAASGTPVDICLPRRQDFALLMLSAPSSVVVARRFCCYEVETGHIRDVDIL